MFPIETPTDRLIKTLKCQDVKRNTRIWGRVTEENRGIGAKIFNE